MKKFEEPVIEVKSFTVDDIITVSTGGGIGGDQELEIDPG